MALLQISEPGLSAAPHQRRLAAGIDLGTTNSLVATVRSGQAETLADHEGRHLLPSVVHYQQQGHSVGYDARTNAALDTANTISSVKRLMGRSLADIQQRYLHLPYQFQASENGLPMIETAAGLLKPGRGFAGKLLGKGRLLGLGAQTRGFLEVCAADADALNDAFRIDSHADFHIAAKALGRAGEVAADFSRSGFAQCGAGYHQHNGGQDRKNALFHDGPSSLVKLMIF